MEEPREKACVVKTLRAKDQVAIFAEQVAGRVHVHSVHTFTHTVSD